MSEETEFYIGDGVYASLEHDMIRLRTCREPGIDHVIYLEYQVWQNLVVYGLKCWPTVSTEEQET